MAESPYNARGSEVATPRMLGNVTAQHLRHSELMNVEPHPTKKRSKHENGRFEYGASYCHFNKRYPKTMETPPMKSAAEYPFLSTTIPASGPTTAVPKLPHKAIDEDPVAR